jgi:hypothetical protein
MCGDSHLPAHIQEWAGGAVGQAGGADVLAEWDEQLVDLNPVRLGQDLFERQAGLFGGCRGNIAPAVCNAVDVNVDADERLPAGYSERQMGAFNADAVEAEQGLLVAGQLALVMVNDLLGDGENLAGFAIGKRAGGDQLKDLLLGELSDLLRTGGNLEQAHSSRQRDLIVGADGDDAADELLEKSLIALLGQLEHGGLWEGLDGLANAVHCAGYVKGLFLHGCPHRGPRQTLFSGHDLKLADYSQDVKTFGIRTLGQGAVPDEGRASNIGIKVILAGVSLIFSQGI